jgi:hypothetical protein
MELEVGTIIQSDVFVKGSTEHFTKSGVIGIIGNKYIKDVNARDKTRKRAKFIIEHIIKVSGTGQRFGREGPGPSTEYLARRTDKNGRYDPKGELIKFADERSCTFLNIDASKIKILGRIEKDSEDYRLLSEQIMTKYLGF